MGAIEHIYSILAGDQVLTSYLAKSRYDKQKKKPAIYELWPANNAPMPYIVLDYDQNAAGGHFAKVNGRLDVHVFVDQRDTIKTEIIKDRIIYALDWELIRDVTGGLIRVYKGDIDSPAGSEDPDVIHWLVDFNVIYYRSNFFIE